MIIGSHVPFNKKERYLLGANWRAIENGANAMMFYLGPSRSLSLIGVEELNFKEYSKLEDHKKIAIENIVVHGPHPVNYSSVNPDLLKKSRDFVIREIKLMEEIGLDKLVIHPGSYTGGTKEECTKILIEGIKYIVNKTKNVHILIEGMAGKGSELCSSLEEIAALIKTINHKRVGICLDTCHLWDSGFDVTVKGALSKKVKKLGILEKVEVIHVNDSKNDLGSHKDRHENIGKGKIGARALQEIVHDPLFENVIKILETPPLDKKNNIFMHKEEIELLLSV